MRFLLIAGLLLSCRRHKSTDDSSTPLAYTLRGAIMLNEPEGAAEQPLLGLSNEPNVDILLFANNAPGFCLQGSEALAAAAYNVSGITSLSALNAPGVSYELSVQPVPGQTYPITLYPVAVLQKTSAFSNPCETPQSTDSAPVSPIYNAVGVYGAGTPDACCALAPSPIVIKAAESEVDNVDFVLTAATGPPGGCPVPFNGTCAYRRNLDGSDSACWTALGDSAASVIHAADNSACP
jgi:hypothetical protein